jgi:hypothetical protein
MADSYAKVLSSSHCRDGSGSLSSSLGCSQPFAGPARRAVKGAPQGGASQRDGKAALYGAALVRPLCGAAKAFVNSNKPDGFHPAEAIVGQAPSLFVLIGLNDLIAAPVAAFSGWRSK